MSQFSSVVAPESLEQHIYSPSTGRAPNSAANSLFDYFGPSNSTTPINAYDKVSMRVQRNATALAAVLIGFALDGIHQLRFAGELSRQKSVPARYARRLHFAGQR